MYVEAVMGAAPETANSTAIAAFQEVRSRANINTEVDVITKLDLLRERRVELAFENHRFFDLLRFGVAHEVLGDYSAANGYGYSATDLLLPIPQNEINLSKDLLTQNPGYN